MILSVLLLARFLKDCCSSFFFFKCVVVVVVAGLQERDKGLACVSVCVIGPLPFFFLYM